MSQCNVAEMCRVGELWNVFRDWIVIAEFPLLRQNHDRHRCNLLCNGADVRGSLGSKIRACLKVRLSKRPAINNLSLFCDYDGTVELTVHAGLTSTSRSRWPVR